LFSFLIKGGHSSGGYSAPSYGGSDYGKVRKILENYLILFAIFFFGKIYFNS
jgi:hypothetical protein